MASPFEHGLSTLNTEQRRAVETIEGPVMVVAGPGTGKTQVLTMRIANILQQTDTSPQAILALTFTESAAHNMRQRLVKFIGEAAYRVRIETFHAFCDDVIRSHPECFPIHVYSQPLGDIEKFQSIEDLLDTLPLTAVRTVSSPYHYLPAILKAISDLKREGVSAKKYLELVEAERQLFEQERDGLKKTELVKREKEIVKMEELSTIFAEYQKILSERRRYDYDDMIRFVVEGFQTHDILLAEYQEQFLYFLVDEYQDTNTSQNTVIDLLASYWSENANVCVVGDPHQSIYRFQGASLENTLTFLNRYPNAKLIHLTEGYRSPQPIYDAAAAVISKNPVIEDVASSSKIPQRVLHQLSETLRLPLNSQKNSNDVSIVVAPQTQPTEEFVYVTQHVQKLIASGVEPSQIAVLYRNNADGTELQEIFIKHQIPVAVEQTKNVLESSFVQQILGLMRTILSVRSGEEREDLGKVLLSPWWSLDRLTVLQLLRSAGKTHLSVYERVKAGLPELLKLQDTSHFTALDLVTVEDVFDRLERWTVEEAQKPFVLWFEQILQESGITHWISEQPIRLQLLEELHALIQLTQRLSQESKHLSLEEFLTTIAVMEDHHLPVMIESSLSSQQGVKFSTVHKAKGQEWQYVFLIRCVDGRWGNSRAGRSLPLPSGILQFKQNSADQQIEDDRRLFYVALTRAKQQITITYPESLPVGQALKPVLGSMFITEIPEQHKEVITSSFSEDELTTFMQKIVEAKSDERWTVQELEWLKKVASEFALSSSSLNLYLRSPEEFFQNYILKLPQPTSAHLVFGTAVHSALEFIYRTWKEAKEVPAQSEVFARFEHALHEQYLEPHEYQRRLHHGKNILTQYLETQPISSTQPLFVEKFFGYGASTTMLGDIRLTGQIDRVDLVDPEQHIVQVIDYKTGRSRTINEIEGKVGTTEYSERELQLPESIRGWYKRQLVFYKLLLELDKSFTGKIIHGTFEYVEPEDSGKYVTRDIILDDEAVRELKNLIQQVITEIRELKFLTSRS
jgi:DNA helicase II / ATP-dependent DNA helicase PcrA